MLFLLVYLTIITAKMYLRMSHEECFCVIHLRTQHYSRCNIRMQNIISNSSLVDLNIPSSGVCTMHHRPTSSHVSCADIRGWSPTNSSSVFPFPFFSPGFQFITCLVLLSLLILATLPNHVSLLLLTMQPSSSCPVFP